MRLNRRIFCLALPATLLVGCSGASTGDSRLVLPVSAQPVRSQAVSPQWRTFRLLHSFGGPGDPLGGPEGTLVSDVSGNLYGITFYGGAYYGGTAFKVGPRGHEKLLHAFGGTAGDGAVPTGGLLLGADGTFYGVTGEGGASHNGTVFELTESGSEKVLYAFGTGQDGQGPQGPLVRDAANNLYGVTIGGGKHNLGTVFKIGPAPGRKESILYNFGDAPTDGAEPYVGLYRDSSGNLFGTNYFGGVSGYGGVFELSAAGQEKLLYNFSGGSDGSEPNSQLVADAAGNLYGTTLAGGGNQSGVVFKITPSGAETVVFDFANAVGYSPSGIIRDAKGNMYVTTFWSRPIPGNGTLYKVTDSGVGTLLYNFSRNSKDGQYPSGRVLLNSSGQFFGTLSSGGTYGRGAIYRLTI